MHAFAPVCEGSLFYEIQGKGSWLVLVHGAWFNHKCWKWVIPDLSKTYRTLRFDLRGHGKSTKLRKPYSVKGFSHDLDHLISHTEVNELVLIGWSLGGMISLQYCIDHPGKVKALVLISTRSQKYLKMKLEVLLLDWLTRIGLVSFKNEMKKRFEKMFLTDTPMEVVNWSINQLLLTSRKDFVLIAKSFWGCW